MHFQDINEFKRAAERFPRGRIVPKRLVRVHQRTSRGRLRQFKNRHNFVFGSDTYVLNFRGVHIIAFEGDVGLRIRGAHRAELQLFFNPHGALGSVLIGTAKGADAQLDNINAVLKEVVEGTYRKGDPIERPAPPLHSPRTPT